jgi:hypothetical protein
VTTNLLGTWMVTHVSPRKKTARSYLAVAVTGEKAKSKVFLATGLPFDELYAVLVRRDEKPIDPKDWNQSFEKFLGPLEQFMPRHTRACPHCEGRGFDKVWDGPCNSDWHPEKCKQCGGTGVRLRRPRG